MKNLLVLAVREALMLKARLLIVSWGLSLYLPLIVGGGLSLYNHSYMPVIWGALASIGVLLIIVLIMAGYRFLTLMGYLLNEAPKKYYLFEPD